MKRLITHLVVALVTFFIGISVEVELTENRLSSPDANPQEVERPTQNVPDQAPSVAKEPQTVSPNKTDLLTQVRLFSEDIGEIGRQAWGKLEAYPRQELINELSRIQGSTPDESVGADIAFVFCNLGHEYPKNRALIISAFKHSLQEGRGPADHYEGLIDRLIQKGDRGLLDILIAAAPRSDGALSEGLAGTFADQMQSSPQPFLGKLKLQPREVRREVYVRISYAMSDKDKIMEALRAVPQSSPIAGVAKEMSQELSKVKDEH